MGDQYLISRQRLIQFQTLQESLSGVDDSSTTFSTVLEVLYKALESAEENFSEAELGGYVEDLKALRSFCDVLDSCYSKIKTIRALSSPVPSESTASAIFISEILPKTVSHLLTICGCDTGLYKIHAPVTEKMNLRLKGLRSILNLIQSIKKSEIFPFWNQLLPSSSHRITSLSLCLESHRRIVLSIYEEFFKKSAPFLKLADERKGKYSSSFIPVSLLLAESLSDLNTMLLFDSTPEEETQDVPLSRAVLKTLQALADNVPYHKLRSGLLTALKEKSIHYVQSSPTFIIQVAGLSVISSILTEHPKHPEVISSFDELYTLFMHLMTSSNENNVRYVAIYNLGALCEVDTEKFLERVEEILPHIESNLNDPDESIVLHILRLVKNVGRLIQSCSPDDKRVLLFWEQFLSKENFQIIEKRDCSIFKAAFCDCLRDMGQSVFHALPNDRRFLSITYLLSYSQPTNKDNQQSVVSSALRGIGTLITYQGPDTDPSFLVDSGEKVLAILSNASSHRSLIFSGTWTLANLANCLAADKGNIYMDFPPHLTIRLIEIATLLAKDLNAKMNVRANCVRSLGSFLQSMNGDNFELDILLDIITNAIHVIVLNASKGKIVKVRWNACYAAGCILKNEILFETRESWRLELIQTLIPIIDECPNFKVRIAAANSLSCVTKRETFKSETTDLYFKALSSLMNAFVTSASILEDPEESKHKADLTDQIVLTLCHLVTLGDASDLHKVNEAALEVNDYLSSAFTSTSARISPEKFSIFLDVKKHIDEINNSTKGNKGPYSYEEDRVFDQIIKTNVRD
ncbi:HEAT repeat-containing protein 6 [Lepeophtheirus salmonis]|uniref:HEAT repeat-containing protein 6 n=1 Tax=Lepeophtheirus salmonis TaxID=72036 RepID=UPI001AE62425|nr:HEAT repeat-containing protein 6-like [Lepeophtheirus salmonis]